MGLPQSFAYFLIGSLKARAQPKKANFRRGGHVRELVVVVLNPTPLKRCAYPPLMRQPVVPRNNVKGWQNAQYHDGEENEMVRSYDYRKQQQGDQTLANRS